MDYTSYKDVSLRDYLRVIFRHKLMILLMIIVLMSTIYINLQLKTQTYVAQVKMLLAARFQTEADYYTDVRARGNIKTQSELVKSATVIKRVVDALKLYSRPIDYERNYASRLKKIIIDSNLRSQKRDIEAMTPAEKKQFFYSHAVNTLLGQISIQDVQDTNMLILSVQDYNPYAATTIANSLSRSYIIFDLEQQIAELKLKYGEKHSIVIQLQNHIEDMMKTLDGRLIPDIEAIGPATVKIIEQARGAGPVSTVSDNTRLIVSFFMSIFLGIIVAFVFDYLDQTIKSPYDVEKFLNVLYLGSIPKRNPKSEILINSDFKSTDFTESYEKLSDQLYLKMKNQNMKTLLFVDMDDAAEIKAVAANIGICLSHKAGHRVLIIDADLRSQALSKIMKISNGSGLSRILEKEASFEDEIWDMGNNLQVLPAGETGLNPVSLLGSSVLSDIIEQAKERYDIVIIKCADIKKFTDAVSISNIADGVALVINEGADRRHIVKQAILSLTQKEANIIGAVLANRRYVIPGLIYKIT